MSAENVTLTGPVVPIIWNSPLIEARPAEVSKPAVVPGINPVAPLEPVKDDAEAEPVPVAKPPGAGTSVALAVLGSMESYWVFAPAWA
jgi:hypothetical protein